MPGFLLSLVMLFGLIAPGDAAASQPQGCADLEAYLTTAGERITDRLEQLLSDGAWVESFERSSGKASEMEMGILGLDEQDVEPMIDIMAVPGDALLEMHDEDVPPIARELHDSAVLYHQSMPAMLKVSSTDGVFAAMEFSGDLEEAEASNRSAQGLIRDACSPLITQIESFGETHDVINLAGAVMDPESLDAGHLSDMGPQDYQAVSFSLLFFAADMPDGQADAPSGPPPAGDTTSDEGASKSGIPRIGNPAPDFEMTTFDGDTFRLSDHRGEVVIVNFWGSWCPPCRDEMPAFQQVWEESGDDVTFVGVGSKRDSEENAVAFAEEFGVTYPIGRDTEGGTPANGQITLDYRIMVFPTTYVVDPNGDISAIVMFGMDTDDLGEYIDQARNR